MSQPLYSGFPGITDAYMKKSHAYLTGSGSTGRRWSAGIAGNGMKNVAEGMKNVAEGMNADADAATDGTTDLYLLISPKKWVIPGVARLIYVELDDLIILYAFKMQGLVEVM